MTSPHLSALPGARSTYSPVAPLQDGSTPSPKPFHHYIPLFVTILLVLAPHPSLLIVLVKYHLLTLHSPLKFSMHLFVTYTLTFLIFSSLIVCAARDPGAVGAPEAAEREEREGVVNDGEMSFEEALMVSVHDSDSRSSTKWCRKCVAPKPERAHHCSDCGRCVLKMDHHCPWIGATCVGHRTYPAFFHFLTCITLLALYVACVSSAAVWWAFSNPWELDEAVVIHELIITVLGVVFTIVMGSFLTYHIYLISTNQTTLENISPFILLRHLPPLPEGSNRHLSSPPHEDELSYDQRRLVRYARGQIRLYDVGFKQNWVQVFGWDPKRRPWGWLGRILYGGGGAGDGRSFPRNPRADEMLNRLARDLVRVDKDA